MRDKMASKLGVRHPTLWCTVCQHAFERRIYHCLTDINVIIAIDNTTSKKLPSSMTKWFPN
jgi:hypothetical protein